MDTIVDQEQSIASLKQIATTMDGIALDESIQVMFSFGTDTQHILTLKSITVEHLLKNQHVSNLNLNTCCLTLDVNSDQILSKDDYRKQVGTYQCDDGGTIHFRILIPINIRKNDDKQDMKIFLKNNITTVEQLLQLIGISDNGNLYLTSNDTQRIFQNNENVINLNTQNFILVEGNETRAVLIENGTSQSTIDRNDNINEIVRQRFRTSATIGDIMKENNIDYCNQQLLHENDFVPAESIPLSCFTSPIRCQLINTISLSVVTIINTDDNNHSLTFYCSPSTNTERILEIAGQLFRIKKEYYCLHYGKSKIDEGILLEDLDVIDNKFEFQLMSTTTIKCLISYTNRTTILPCNEETQVSEIVEYALESLNIENGEIDSYELFLIHNVDRPQVGGDLTIEDLLQMLYGETRPAEILTLKFELEKKND